MAGYQEYQIWAAYLNEALGTTRDLLSRPDDWNPQLQSLWYHPDAEELAAADASERVKHGYLERLTPDTPAFRGQNDNRQQLHPPVLLDDEEDGTYQNLSLRGVKATNCHLLLDLGRLELKVSFISPNATVQLYWPDAWTAIADTPRYKYGTRPEQRMLTFSVALALDFGDFVISLNGPENLLFTVEWSPRFSFAGLELDRPAVTDMLDDWTGYMQHVVWWLEITYSTMTEEDKDLNIASFLSQNSHERDLFAGINHQSRSEVLHRAGLSPELTLREVVEARSRFYRLILATWQYKYLVLSHTWPTFIRPTIRDRVFTPLFEQRLRYATESLLVTGKNPISVSTRLDAQITAVNGQSESSESEEPGKVMDAFEPSLVEDALRHAPEFGPGVFSKTFWSLHADEISEQPWATNPLVVKDTREGVFLSGVDLVCTESWTELFLPVKLRRARFIKSYVYALNGPDEVWTPLKPNRRVDLQITVSPRSYGDVMSTEDRYMVGVLESPGVAVGIKLRTGRGTRYIFPSRGAVTEEDPTIYSTMRKNIVKTLARIHEYTDTLARRGKTALSEEERAQRERAYEAFDEMWLDRFGHLPIKTPGKSESTTEHASGPKKRGRRRQVDLVLADIRDEDEPGARKRARKENGISMTIDKERDWWDYPYYGDSD